MAAPIRFFNFLNIYKTRLIFRRCLNKSVTYNKDKIEVPNNISSNSMNDFIKNLRSRTIRKSVNYGEVQKKPMITTLFVEQKTRNAIHKTDEKCDEVIRENLNESLDKALESLKQYAKADRYPKRKTFMYLIQNALEELDLEKMNQIINFVSKVYPKEYEWEMGYKHYVAEYHWKMGNYSEAFIIFEELFSKHSQRKKKLSDISKFMAIKLINEGSEDEVNLLVSFVINLINKYNLHQPATNVWYLLFLSEKGSYNNLSRKLLDIKPDEIVPFIVKKISGILKAAFEQSNTDYIQRLIESILFLQIKSEYTKVFSSLLELQCVMGDSRNAKETFRYCSSEGIALEGTVILQYSELLSGNKKTLPKMESNSQHLKLKF